MEKSEEKRTREVFGEIVQYSSGHAWGIAADGRTVYLGKEADVRAAVSNERLKCGEPLVGGIISLERELQRKEMEHYGRRPEGNFNMRAQKPKRPGRKRVRPVSLTRRFRNHLR